MAVATDESISGAIARWREHDRGCAIHPKDRDAIDATEAARSLVLQRMLQGPSRDLYSACARLGRLLFDAGASPSLAVSTIDGAARALDEAGAVSAGWDRSSVRSARSALAEGFAAAGDDDARVRARRAWAYPVCAVRVDDQTATIAIGFDDDDADETASWAARVARGLSKDGVRRVILGTSRSSRAKTELEDALTLVGITLEAPRTPQPPTDAPTPHLRAPGSAPSTEKRSWLRLPWWSK